METNLPDDATRFVSPRIGNRTVARSELLARLCGSPPRKLALLTAGAGFGKTTLMAQWRQQLITEGAGVTWLSLRPGDALPERFHALLRNALLYRLPEGALAAPSHGNATTPASLCAASLIQALAGVRGELYLMIDGLEHADHPGCHALLQAIVEARLPGLRVIAASRKSPGMLLGRQRAMGRVAEIGSAELAFSSAEALAFLRLHLDPGVGLDTVTRLHELSGGWPAGLQLLAGSLRSRCRASPRHRPKLPDMGSLDAYLSEDVVSRVPHELVEFMQTLSILPRFNAGLAACVSNCGQAAALIESIAAHGLFLLQAEEEHGEPWYRFHPMFARYLHRRLMFGHSLGIASLHLRAMHWFASQDRFGEAVLHALQADDFGVVPGLVERAIPDPPSLTQLREVRRWLDMTPPRQLADHPRLLLLAGWANVAAAQPEQAESWLSTLEGARAGATTSRHGRLLRAAIAVQRDEPAAAQALLQTLVDNPIGHPVVECVRLGLTARCLAAHGRYVEARAAIAEIGAITVCEQSTSATELASTAQALAASVSLLQGDALQAEQLAAIALAEAERRHGRRSVSACFSAAVLAEALYERDRVEEARVALADRLDVLGLSAPETVIRTALCHARLLWQANLPHEALAYLSEMEVSFHRRSLPRGIAYMLAMRIRIALAGDDQRHARGLQGQLDAMADETEHSCLDTEIRAVVALSRARLSLAGEDPWAALQAIDTVRSTADALGREGLMVISDLLQALAQDALGKRPQAMACLESALATSYRLGLVRTLLDEGEPVRRLLLSLRPHTDEARQAYLERLQVQPASTSPTRVDQVAPVASSRQAGRNIVLTPREQQVLDLLSHSMSNKRIALALNISELTVKWNLKQIFAKLGVSRRYDAIVAARRLEQGVG